ncbi:ABC transporter permease subunit [Roseomonas hellenica]|uniref:ABC transporter permease subunit n=1 Tax=Plastoroseomonas hellenica TaxID=2687306 RepID=A0ABS5F4R5_9PROT|nr:ABC transporter permease subunit [Plastoroseomonas hellenica]MBR0667564.1 ABC transporter permease subunit [Plastoroseomonas hellenica]
MTGRDRQRAALLLPALLLLALGFLAPLATVAWTSLRRAGHFSLAAYAEILASPVFLDILLRTLWMAVLVTALCAALGYPFAYCVATRARRHAGLIMALVTVPYLTSILIRSYAWVAILGGGGLVNRTLIALGLIEDPLQLVFNSFGSYVGMVHILLPMMVLPLYAAMRRIDGALLLAGRGLGGGPMPVFVTVFLPLSLPGLAAGSALVFLSALGFYIAPALLGAPGDYMLAQAIEVRVATLAEFDVAAGLSCILLVLVGGFLMLFRRRIVSLADDPASTPARVVGVAGLRPACAASAIGAVPGLRAALNAMGDAVAPLAGPLLHLHGAALLVFMLAPMLVVVLIACSSAPYLTFPPPGYSWRWFMALLDDANWLEAAWFSLTVSTAAAVAALAIGTPFAFGLARGRFGGRRLLWLLAVSPMILPHIVIGLGLFFTFVALGLNGHPVSFWLAYTVIGLPYVVIILLSALGRFDVDLERAAANLGAAPMTAFRTVTLPLLAASFVTAFLFAFLSGFDDLIIGLFLSSPRGTTLAIRMWEDIRLEISPKTAVVGVVQLGVLLVAMTLPMLRTMLPRRRVRTEA